MHSICDLKVAGMSQVFAALFSLLEVIHVLDQVVQSGKGDPQATIYESCSGLMEERTDKGHISQTFSRGPELTNWSEQ
jgi:hypothetical protein